MVAFVPKKSVAKQKNLEHVGSSNEVAVSNSEKVIVARIGAAYGVKGWAKVHPFSHSPDALQNAKQWFIAPYIPQQAESEIVWQSVTVQQFKAHSDAWVAHCQEWHDRTAVERLKGWQIAVLRSDFPQTDENEFYWVDLMGAQVVNQEGALLGVVTQLLENTAQTVLHITAADEASKVEYLIPFVGAFIGQVDLQSNPKQITVDWDVTATA